MADVIHDFGGFETGGLEEIDAASGATIQSASPPTGSYYVRIAGPTGSVSTTGYTYSTTGWMWFGARVKVPSGSSGTASILRVESPSKDTFATVKYNYSTNTVTVEDSTSTQVLSVVKDIEADWHYITVGFDYSGSSASSKLLIDGVEEDTDATGDFIPLNVGAAALVLFNTVSGTDVDFDDYYLRTGATSSDAFTEVEVFGYSHSVTGTTPDAGGGGSAGATLDAGAWEDTIVTAGNAEYTGTGDVGTVDFDGPNGDGNIDGDSNIKATKLWANVDRDGGGGTTHYLYLGDSGDGNSPQEFNDNTDWGPITTTPTDYFIVKDTALPLASENIRAGFGTGGAQDIHLYETMTFILHVPDAEAAASILPADKGTFTHTGQAANLNRDSLLTADKGTFTETGIAADFAMGYTLTADKGTFAHTGTATALTADRTITADKDTFTQTGFDANLNHGYSLTADVGTYTETGISSNLNHGYSLTADVGTYTETGLTADLLASYTLPSSLGTYTETGLTANLMHGYKLSADVGAYTETSISSNLNHGYSLTADVGTYTETSISSNLNHGYKLSADVGTYTETGVAVGLISGYSFVADVGTYTESGVDANLIADYKLTADVGSYSESGFAAGLLGGEHILASLGTFIGTGKSANLIADYKLTADSGTFTHTGVASTITVYRVLSTDQGNYTLVGQPATFTNGYILTASSGEVTLLGQSATLATGAPSNYTLVANTGEFTQAGITASLVSDHKLNASLGNYGLTGFASGLLDGEHIAANIGTYNLTGPDTSLTADYKLTADVGSYTETGIAANLTTSYKLSAEPASYNISGSDAILNVGHKLISESGSYNLTGFSINLNRDYNLIAESRAFDHTGIVVGLTRNYKLSSNTGTYIVTGMPINFGGNRLFADLGTIISSGAAADFRYDRRLTADLGGYTIIGRNITPRNKTYRNASVNRGTLDIPTKVYGQTMFSNEMSYYLFERANDTVTQFSVGSEKRNQDWTLVLWFSVDRPGDKPLARKFNLSYRSKIYVGIQDNKILILDADDNILLLIAEKIAGRNYYVNLQNRAGKLNYYYINAI